MMQTVVMATSVSEELVPMLITLALNSSRSAVNHQTAQKPTNATKVSADHHLASSAPQTSNAVLRNASEVLAKIKLLSKLSE